MAFSCGHVTVTLTWLSDFCVAFPVSSQLGGLSGCQVGSKSKTGGELEVSGVTFWFRPAGSASRMLLNVPAESSLVNAIRVPSGENAGLRSLSGPLVSCAWPEPSAFITQMSAWATPSSR